MWKVILQRKHLVAPSFLVKVMLLLLGQFNTLQWYIQGQIASQELKILCHAELCCEKVKHGCCEKMVVCGTERLLLGRWLSNFGCQMLAVMETNVCRNATTNWGLTCCKSFLTFSNMDKDKYDYYASGSDIVLSVFVPL